MENNAKCPKCNGEFFAESGTRELKCPYCGETADALRARKYYSFFHDKAAVTHEAHGESLMKFEELLRIGSHHLERSEFADARKAYERAVELNPGDYRGYMGLVAVETENYTDLKNTSHKQYLQRAVSVANDEQQKAIASVYRNYDLKASMSDEEYENYLSEKQKDFKARVKSSIIGFSKVNDNGKKKAKNAFIAMLSMIAAGAIMLVLGLVFSSALLLGAGALVALSSYGLSFMWTRQRYNERLYEFMVALFNALKDFGLDREETEHMLKLMAAVLLSVKEGDPVSRTDGFIEEMAGYLLNAAGERGKTFLKAQKFTAKYIEK